jgi:hypothetical protein
MYVGQRIECINDDGFPILYRFANYPVKGGIYTVRDFSDIDGDVLLNEIVNTISLCQHSGTGDIAMRECSFDQDRFRPLTDISVLEELLKVKEMEDA